jgi:hypothetical protein
LRLRRRRGPVVDAFGLLGLAAAALHGRPGHDVKGGFKHGEPALLVRQEKLDAVLARLVVLRYDAVLI